MIPVTFYHGRQIFLPILSEVKMVIKRIFFGVPAVKAFINNQHAVLVTGVKKCRGHRIVGSAYGVETGIFQDPDLSFFQNVECTGTGDTIVMVNTAALQFDRLSVQKESFTAESDRANAEGCFLCVAACCNLQRIEVR